MPFAHDVAGGNGNLVVASLKSPNFIHGSQGWSVNKDGSAELNDVTVRGTVTGSVFDGTDFEITSDGVFIYSGTPALGNLAISLAPSGTTSDSFGNVVQGGGLKIYGPAGQDIFLGLAGALSELQFQSGSGFEQAPGNLAGGISGSGGSESMQLLMSGPQGSAAGGKDWVQVQLASASQDGTTLAASAGLNYINNAGTSLSQYTWGAAGPRVRPGDGNAYFPGLRSPVMASNVTVSSTATFTLLTWLVSSGITYRVRGRVKCVQGATAAAQLIGLSGVTTGSPTQLFYNFVQDGAAQSFSTITSQASIGFLTSPAYVAGRTFYLEIDATITPTSSGTMGLVAAEGTSGDPFTVAGGSFMDVWQVVP